MNKPEEHPTKKSKKEPDEHQNEKEEKAGEPLVGSSYLGSDLPKSNGAAKARKKAHAQSIYNLRSEQNLNGKKFRDSPAVDSDDDSETDFENDQTKELIDQISLELKNEDAETRVDALKSLVHLLVDPSLSLKKFVTEGECMDILMKCLLSQEVEEKFQATWCITNIAAGVPELCKRALSVLPTLNALLTSNEMHIKKQAAWAIGNMAADGAKFRSSIKANGSVPFLIKLLDEEDVELVKTACFALSNLSRHPNSIAKELVQLDIVKKLAHLLENDQMNRAYPEIYWIVAYLTAETEEAGEKIIHSGMMGNIVKHMLELSSFGNLCIPIVRIVGNLTSQSDCYSDVFLNNNTFLPVLFRYLVSDIRSLQKEALWALSNITAGQLSNIEITVDAGLIPIILPIVLEGNFDIRKEAGYVIMNIISKGPDFISVDDLKILIPGYLSFLKSHDYELAELGLQFFISILRYFPSLTGNLENASFVNDLEKILLVFPDAKMHALIKSLLDQYSDILENEAPQDRDAETSND